MNLTYNQMLNLKGKKLKNINPNSSDFGRVFTVTSSTKKYITLDFGIKIITNIFFETKQHNYEIPNTQLHNF